MVRKNAYLLLFVLVASLTLISINYYTIKILSGVRSYINGESEYSKGQKDASLYLYTYIATGDTAYMKLFNASIWVPMADNLARRAMISEYDDSVAYNYFLLGRNHAEDVPNMVWLFKKFQSSYMKVPIRIWTDAEPILNQLYNIGVAADVKIKKKSLTEEEKLLLVKNISTISAQLYEKESSFSKVLGDEARKINRYLLLANIFCIFIIIGNIALYAVLMIQRLTAANRKLLATNKEIIETNKELDTLVYSVSHDLRSPITSIQGLIYISKEENDIDRLREYIGLIDKTIQKQDSFIHEIIHFFKTKHTALSFSEFSLKELIEDIVANNEFIPTARGIVINYYIDLNRVYTDQLRLKMIINNLVSNAIKYSDNRKPERMIAIKTRELHNKIVIEIEDNGLGIDKKSIDKIYNMFFVGANANKGTGLGLYILKQNVDKLNGRVEVESELNAGTKFTVFIPMV